MPEAWQVRAYERQRFLESLTQSVWGHCEKNDADVSVFSFEILIIVASFLKSQLLKSVHEGTDGPAYDFFTDKILAPTVEFSRTDAERWSVMGDLALKLCQTGLHPFATDLLRQEVHEQPLLYQGHHAMDEVELPAESD